MNKVQAIRYILYRIESKGVYILRYHEGKMGELYWKTYEGDCRKTMERMITTMIEPYIDCIVTSPPYWERRSYGDRPKKVDGNKGIWAYSNSKQTYEAEIGNNCSYEKYIEDLGETIKGCFQLLKDNKFMFINIGNKHKDKELHDYSFNIIQKAKESGFIHCDTIIWIKRNSQPPGKYKEIYLGNAWEYILMFAKGKNYKLYPERYMTTQSHFVCNECGRDNYIDLNASPNYIYSNIGCFGKKNKMQNAHPAIFPIDIPKFCLSLTTEVNGIVFDPFVGSGTTLQAALQLGMNAIGCEVIPILYDKLVENMNIFTKKSYT